MNIMHVMNVTNVIYSRHNSLKNILNFVYTVKYMYIYMCVYK